MVRVLVGTMLLSTYLLAVADEGITISKPSDVCMKSICLHDDFSKFKDFSK